MPRSARPRGARILLDRRPGAADDARMTDADFSAAILLFGPYRTLRFRHGGTLRCEPRKLGPFPPGSGGAGRPRLRRPEPHPRHLGLPAPRGQGYAAGAGHGGC